MLHDPKFFNRFQGLTRLIDTQPFQLLDSEEQIRVALGNTPLSLMRKDFHTWKQEATVICGEFAHALRMHLRPLQPIVPHAIPMMKNPPGIRKLRLYIYVV